MFRLKQNFSRALVYLAVFSYAFLQFVTCVPVQSQDESIHLKNSDVLVKPEPRQFFENAGGNGNIQNQNALGLGGGGGLFGGRPQQQVDEDDDEETTTIQGPGAIGVLAGLFGIGNALLKGSGVKVIESTLNFYPPSLREKAAAQLNSFLGKTTPKPPPTNATTAGSTVKTTTPKTTTEEEEYDDTFDSA